MNLIAKIAIGLLVGLNLLGVAAIVSSPDMPYDTIVGGTIGLNSIGILIILMLYLIKTIQGRRATKQKQVSDASINTLGTQESKDNSNDTKEDGIITKKEMFRKGVLYLTSNNLVLKSFDEAETIFSLPIRKIIKCWTENEYGWLRIKHLDEKGKVKELKIDSKEGWKYSTTSLSDWVNEISKLVHGPLVVSLDITSEPAGALIIHDGNVIGATPIKEYRIAPDYYSFYKGLMFELIFEGYHGQTIRVSYQLDETRHNMNPIPIHAVHSAQLKKKEAEPVDFQIRQIRLAVLERLGQNNMLPSPIRWKELISQKEEPITSGQEGVHEGIGKDASNINEYDLANNFEQFTPESFEKVVAAILRKMGYDVEDLPYVGDFGADLRAKAGNDTVVVQVKKWDSANVGAPEIQKTLGAMYKYKANRAIVVSASDFTAAAREQARDAPVELWNKDVLHQKVRLHLLSG